MWIHQHLVFAHKHKKFKNKLYVQQISLAETRLTTNESSNEYLIPPHGMISYTRANVRVLEKHKRTDVNFKGILLYIQHTLLPILVHVIGVYVSPECKFVVLTELFVMHSFSMLVQIWA